MSVDYKYAELYPRQYEFVMSCNFGQAKEALDDPYCPDWAKDLLKQRFSTALAIQKRMTTRKRRRN